MKILLYGIGQALEVVEKKIRKEHKIIGYTDSFAKIKKYRGRAFYQLCNLKDLDFDYLVITLKDRKIAWEIQNILAGQYGIPLEKIIPFYVYANRELWRIKMQNYELEKVQGLIFGNSLAAYGFIEKELEIPFVNLAVPSQDLYYCYRVFCQCMNQYRKKLCNLKYIVIDLYNYMEFNLDLSCERNLLEYILAGGIHEEHNFMNNKNYSETLENEIFREYYYFLKDTKQNSMNSIFSNCSVELEELKCERWYHIQKDPVLRSEQIIGGTIVKRYEDSVQENKYILECFMKAIMQFNTKIKVVFTLLPQYINMEKVSEPFMAKWKDEFYKIITDVCGRYHALFWDFKTCKEISENYMFYYDEMHLNMVGARAMSAILNEKLKQI